MTLVRKVQAVGSKSNEENRFRKISPITYVVNIFGKESYIAARNMKKFIGGQFDTREAKKDKKTLEAQQ